MKTTKPKIKKRKVVIDSKLINQVQLMPLKARLDNLGMTEEQRNERKKDMRTFFAYIIEKVNELVYNEKENAKNLNILTGIGEFGQNLAAEMQDLLEDHPLVSDDILKFLRKYENISEMRKSWIKQYNITAAGFDELVFDIGKIFSDIEQGEEELKKINAELDTATTNRNMIVSQISEETPKRDSLKTEIDKFLAQRDSIILENINSKQETTKLNGELEIKRKELEMIEKQVTLMSIQLQRAMNPAESVSQATPSPTKTVKVNTESEIPKTSQQKEPDVQNVFIPKVDIPVLTNKEINNARMARLKEYKLKGMKTSEMSKKEQMSMTQVYYWLEQINEQERRAKKEKKKAIEDAKVVHTKA